MLGVLRVDPEEAYILACPDGSAYPELVTADLL